jgi:hypothetical protein
VTHTTQEALKNPPENEYTQITAAQAQHLGFGKVQVRQTGEKYWQGVTAGFYYSPQFEYRAIKQARPEPEVATVLRSDFDYCMQDKQRCVRLIEDVYGLVCDNKMSEAKAMIEKQVNNMAVNIPPYIEPEPVDHVKLLGEIYGFLQSSCPEGIADEAFRVVPESLRAQAIVKYAEPRDEVGECVRHTQEVGRIEVGPHADLRAEYIRQRDAVPCELGFYLWEHSRNGSDWIETPTPDFSDTNYRYTDISCYVSKDGEPAIRMLRTEAQALQRELGDTVDWYKPNGELPWNQEDFSFLIDGTYTYRTKATIKLDGNMVTPEQAVTDWEAKKETHELWYRSDRVDWCIWFLKQLNKVENHNEHYELRPKQPTWTGSREDVIALLKEMGVV